MIFCPACGTENDDDSQFCKKCGRSLDDAKQARDGDDPVNRQCDGGFARAA